MMSARAVFGVALLLTGLTLLLIVTNGRADHSGNGLSGSTSHDFGVVDLSREQGPLEHGFRLSNVTDQTIVVNDVSTTCGCTSAQVSSRRIEPGEDTIVSARLHVTKSGHKSARILVWIDGVERPLGLKLQATGRFSRQLLAATPRLTLSRDKPASVELRWVDYESDSRPPDLSVEPTTCSVTFSSWQQLQECVPEMGVPARWMAEMEVACPGEFPAGEQIHVRAGDESAVTIRLRARIQTLD